LDGKAGSVGFSDPNVAYNLSFFSVKFEGEVAAAADSQQPKADSPSPANTNNGGSSNYGGQPAVNELDWDWKPTPSRGFAPSVLVVPAAIICFVLIYTII